MADAASWRGEKGASEERVLQGIELHNVYIDIFGKSNNTLEESTTSAIVW